MLSGMLLKDSVFTVVLRGCSNLEAAQSSGKHTPCSYSHSLVPRGTATSCRRRISISSSFVANSFFINTAPPLAYLVNEDKDGGLPRKGVGTFGNFCGLIVWQVETAYQQGTSF